MPDQPVPEESVEALAKARWEREHPVSAWSDVGGERRELHLERARHDLAAAAPAIRKQGAEEERKRVREFADKRRDDCNEGALRLNPSTQLGREHSTEARAFGSVVNFLDTLGESDG